MTKVSIFVALALVGLAQMAFAEEAAAVVTAGKQPATVCTWPILCCCRPVCHCQSHVTSLEGLPHGSVVLSGSNTQYVNV